MSIKTLPILLTTIGIGGFISSIPLSIVMSKKIDTNNKKRIDELNKDKEVSEEIKKLPIKEYIKLNWKELGVIAASVVISSGCIIASTCVSQHIAATLAASATAAQTSLTVYKDKVKEVLGEKEAKKVDKKITDEKVAQLETPQKVICKNDECLFYDSITGQIFKSTYEKIKSEANRLNAEAISSTFGEISLNDWLVSIGGEYVSNNDYIGWKLNSSVRDLINLDDFTASLTKSGDSVIVINYINEPVRL